MQGTKDLKIKKSSRNGAYYWMVINCFSVVLLLQLYPVLYHLFFLILFFFLVLDLFVITQVFKHEL